VIFVTVGMNEAPFDRILEVLDGLDLDEELVVQHGASAVRPAGATCLGFLDFDEVVDLVRRSRVVVCHAGVGSIMVALTNGRRPIVVPRLAERGEAVDDHQLALARRLDEAGLVTLVERPEDLPAALTAAEGGPAASLRAGTRLADALAGEIAAVAGPVPRAAAA
jgi:UDP-N-acetylglucosamine transferase subunit ALG13